MNYKIISMSARFKFEQSVSDHIAKGWICQGGVTVDYHDGFCTMTYFQAMIKPTRTVMK